MRKIGETLLALSDSHKMYYDFIDYFLSTPEIIFPDDIKALVDINGRRIIDTIAGVIQQGVDAGKFRKVDPKNFALIFIGNLHGFIHFKKLNKTILKNQNFRDLYSKNIDCFIKGISR